MACKQVEMPHIEITHRSHNPELGGYCCDISDDRIENVRCAIISGIRFSVLLVCSLQVSYHLQSSRDEIQVTDLLCCFSGSGCQLLGFCNFPLGTINISKLDLSVGRQTLETAF